MSTFAPRYRRSSYCASGECVEVGVMASNGDVAVRDSKHPHLEPRIFTPDEWDAFVAGVKAGEFDRFRL